MCLTNLLTAATGMVKLYSENLEKHKVDTRSGKVWTINMVPIIYNAKVRKQVIADGYYFDENGYAQKKKK